MNTPEVTASLVLEALDEGRQIALLSDDPDFDRAAGDRAANALRRMRLARGERMVGRKIGFTNRTIWDEYDVRAPIWGPVYDTTLHPLDRPFRAGGLAEPRIEPEIILRLGRAPRPGLAPEALIACVSHVTLGFEVVQSVFPGWRFRAPDTIAAAALHGALLPGPFHAIDPAKAPDWQRALAGFAVTLCCDGAEADRGNSANVMGGGPLAALSHLVELLAADPEAPPLEPGELVSTGTLTRALPIAPGERWQAEVQGIDLPAITLTVAANP